MPAPRNLHAATTRIMSLALIAVGVAILGRTFAAGGGPLATGVMVGVLFVVAGAGRLWLARASTGRKD